MDGDQPERLFSARFACPICNYSIDELEPWFFLYIFWRLPHLPRPGRDEFFD